MDDSFGYLVVVVGGKYRYIISVADHMNSGWWLRDVRCVYIEQCWGQYSTLGDSCFENLLFRVSALVVGETLSAFQIVGNELCNFGLNWLVSDLVDESMEVHRVKGF